MSSYNKILLTVILLLFNYSIATASHIYGGELSYKYVSDSTYEIKLILYGDCSSARSISGAEILNQLYVAQPKIFIVGPSYLDSVKLVPDANTGAEITPVCPSRKDETSCSNAYASIPGIRRFSYTRQYRLPFRAANWRFIFNSSLSNRNLAGRTASISNIFEPGNTSIRLEATLNNLVYLNNSTPNFTNIPTPFYCVGNNYFYNLGAIDPQNDSLGYQMVSAENALDSDNPFSSELVTYNAGFSAVNPIATSSFSFNPINGQLIFTPSQIQRSVVVQKVTEYRNGTIVGTSKREMSFIVNSGCDGQPSTPYLSNVTGAYIYNQTLINICVGTPFVSFTINVNNPEGDSVFLAANNIPTGASISYTGQGSTNPTLSFNWNTLTLTPGTYTFYLNIANHHCPLYNYQSIAYTIYVANPPILTIKELFPTQCIHKAFYEFTTQYGFNPKIITISNTSGFNQTLTDNTAPDSIGIIRDSIPAGNYTITIKSGDSCSTSYNLIISDTGSLPERPLNASFCLNDPIFPIPLTNIVPGSDLKWYLPNGVLLSSPPVVYTNEVKSYEWYYTESVGVCSTGKVNVTAVVHPNPTAGIKDFPYKVCYGDEVRLIGTGESTYTWLPAELVKKDTAGYYINVVVPSIVIARATNEYGCKDSTSATINDIEMCCNITCPNAFSPNNDGKNDIYRVVNYGNMTYFTMYIYNRWGELVATIANPKLGWDGKHNGQDCDMGVYYYVLRAQCLTGPTAYQTGDITLIR